MSYHHLALAAKDMKAIHAFYEGVMGFELVKVEIAPVMGGGWGKHFFHRMDGDDSRFIAFWELHDTPGKDAYAYDLNDGTRRASMCWRSTTIGATRFTRATPMAIWSNSVSPPAVSPTRIANGPWPRWMKRK